MGVRWTIIRLSELVLTLLVASMVVYGSTFVAPGDPAAFLSGGRGLSPAALAAIRAQYHLDDALPVQYWHWLAGVVQGDFGRSIQYRQSVGGLILSRMPTSGYLAVYAGLIVVVAGVLAGAAAAMGGRRLDAAVTTITTAAAAVPPFVAGLALIAVLSVGLGVLPSGGEGSGFLGHLEHMTLPAIALAMTFVAVVARVTRSSMRAESRREHVEMARARGVPWRRVVTQHVLWNSLPPVFTVLGLVAAGLISGTAVVETTFGINGLGSLLVDSVQTKDFAVVQGVVLILVGAYVVVSTLVDVLYAVVNPRIRTAARR
jgi:peptide/nickel transport system permease protein